MGGKGNGERRAPIQFRPIQRIRPRVLVIALPVPRRERRRSAHRPQPDHRFVGCFRRALGFGRVGVEEHVEGNVGFCSEVLEAGDVEAGVGGVICVVGGRGGV